MKPNILYISIDAMIADRCYGSNKTSKTPNIDSLIKKGTYFKWAFTSSDGTPASFSSIFTGLYPFKAAIRKGRWSFELNKNVKNYVEVLKENGYHAYGTLPELVVIKEFFSLFENNDMTYPFYGFRLYDGLGQQIIDKLESKMEEPWFYFVHLMDAHKPIFFPSELDTEEYGEDDYDRMISSIDIWLGRILEKINLKNTLVILSADHGDYLRVINYKGKRLSFEFKSYAKSALRISNITPIFLYFLKNKMFLFFRDFITKMKIARLDRKLTPFEKRCIWNARSYPERYLYDELFHVPLIFSGYGIPSGRIIEQQIRTIDIFPTIAEILEVKMEHKVDGRSLLPILKGEEFDDLPIYLESGYNLKDFSKAVMGIRTSKYKYFRLMNNPNGKIHLYDLKNDPLEESNIANIKGDIVSEMERILLGIKNKSTINEDTIEEDEKKKVEEQLRKLGYI